MFLFPCNSYNVVPLIFLYLYLKYMHALAFDRLINVTTCFIPATYIKLYPSSCWSLAQSPPISALFLFDFFINLYVCFVTCSFIMHFMEMLKDGRRDFVLLCIHISQELSIPMPELYRSGTNFLSSLA